MPKSQAAMEYLTTYGWAILIIIIVIAGLFSLGVFNGNSYGAKAKEGACDVYRPYGPSTTQLINLQGLCSTDPPQSVAYFNGKNSQVNIPVSALLAPSNQVTVSVWIYANSSSTSTQAVVSKTTSSSPNGYFLGTTSGWSNVDFYVVIGGSPKGSAFSKSLLNNGWHNIVGTFNGFAVSTYVDGSLVGTTSSGSNVLSVASTNLTLGDEPGTSDYFAGRMSNVQVYNTSLSANQINTMYFAGIGEPPQRLQNLVGWWPLNGDMIDYSGDANNGAGNTLFFSSSWISGYTAP